MSTHFPFSFWQGQGFDPAVLPLTTWNQASYVAAPWLGKASAGLSGTRQAANRTGPPGPGASRNGLASVLYDNSGSAIANALIYQTLLNVDLDITDVVNPGPIAGPLDYTVKGAMVINAAAPPGSTASPYTAQSMINGNARWGTWFDDTFIGAWHFNGAFPIVRKAHPGVTVPFAWAMRWKASTLEMQIDINAVTGVPVSLPAVTTLDGVSCLTAIDGFTSALGSFSVWDQQTSKTYDSDDDLTGYFKYIKAKFDIP